MNKYSSKKNPLFLSFILLIIPAILAGPVFSSGYNQADIANTFEKGSLINQIFFIFVFVITIYKAKKLSEKIFWHWQIYLFSFFLILGLIYSDYFLLTLKGCFTAIVSFAFWTYWGRQYSEQLKEDSDYFVKQFISFVLFYGFVELILWTISPKDYSLRGQMADYLGFFQHSNLTAKVICLGVMLNFFYLIDGPKKLFFKISFIVLIGLFFMTGSRTSFIGMALGISVVYMLSTKISVTKKVILTLLVVATVLIFNDELSSFFVKKDVHGAMYESTFTFRLNMWQDLLPLITKNIYIGVGLNAFWNPDFVYYAGPRGIAGVHNGYLQVVQDLGLVGLTFWLMIIITIVKGIVKNKSGMNSSIRNFLIASWIYFFVVNFTEGDLGNYRSSLLALIMSISISQFYFSGKSLEETVNEN